jgi:hypothetical protein
MFLFVINQLQLQHMATQRIREYCVTLLVICFNLSYLACFSQNTSNQSVFFKISKYRKNYKLTDNITLLVENISNKPLYYIVGKEMRDHNAWIEYNMDIKNDPTKDLAGKYEILQPHKFKIITINLKKTSGQPREKHGISHLNRFFLKYHDLNSLVGENEKKIVSKEFIESW